LIEVENFQRYNAMKIHKTKRVYMMYAVLLRIIKQKRSLLRAVAEGINFGSPVETQNTRE